MEVSGYSAEIGRMAGGVLNMVMRSGTNQYHGDVFEYVRNDVIDARGFFDRRKESAAPQSIRRHVVRPGLAAETLQRPQPDVLHVQLGELQADGGDDLHHPRPLAAGAAGRLLESFSLTGQTLTVTDPLSQDAVSRQQIPVSRFNPVAVKLLAYYPLPNRADARNNYITAANDQDPGTASS